jgi:alkylhydroperoxidase/carboxymuconolactone decarboxylase family protein YurZ
MKYSPEYQKALKKRYPKVAACFDDLGKFTAEAGPLDRKMQLMVKLGAAIDLGSEGDTQNLAGQALQEGLTAEELRQAVLLTVTTAGFPKMIVAMQWVEEIIEQKTAK